MIGNEKKVSVEEMTNPDIFDLVLYDDVSFKNGITLCRVCHGKAHGRKWGSHEQ